MDRGGGGRKMPWSSSSFTRPRSCRWRSSAASHGGRPHGRTGHQGRAETRAQGRSPEQHKQVRELGRRLIYIVGPEEEHANKHAPWSDNPGLFVSKLEETADGCLWLLDRWEEFRNLLDRKVKWEEAILVRFIRLQGKDIREVMFDPALNSIYLAWDVLFPNYARTEWEEYRKERQRTDPAYHHRMRWQETGSRPATRQRHGPHSTGSSTTTSSRSRRC